MKTKMVGEVKALISIDPEVKDVQEDTATKPYLVITDSEIWVRTPNVKNDKLVGYSQSNVTLDIKVMYNIIGVSAVMNFLNIVELELAEKICSTIEEMKLPGFTKYDNVYQNPSDSDDFPYIVLVRQNGTEPESSVGYRDEAEAFEAAWLEAEMIQRSKFAGDQSVNMTILVYNATTLKIISQIAIDNFRAYEFVVFDNDNTEKSDG